MTVSALGLCDFVFMVGEAEIDPTAVKINGLPVKGAVDHGVAFQVPSGTTVTPGAVPVVFAVFGFAGFPEGEVAYGFTVIFIGIIVLASRVAILCL